MFLYVWLLCVGPIHMYIPMYTHKESRARQLSFSVTLHLIALRQGLSVNPTTSPSWLGWLVDQKVLRMCLMVSQYCSYSLTQAYTVMPELGSSCLENKLPCPPSPYFPSPYSEIEVEL